MNVKKYINDSDKRSGIVVTISVHLLLLILFLFMGLIIPVPLPEQGILMNFGVTETGTGEIQPNEISATENPEKQNEKVVEETSPPEPTEEKLDVLTQKTEEAPAVNKEKTTKVKVENPKEEVEEQKVNPAALYTGKKSETTPQSEGITKGEGDQGSPEGSKTSTQYTGGGKGPGYYLSGRAVVLKPKIEENTQETGKVVVSIWVDRYGKVIRATPGSKGSTTTNSYLYTIARDAAMKARFSANQDAPEEQIGTIVFEFSVRK